MTSSEEVAEPPFHDRKKIIRYRKRAGLSQATAARRAGITPAHLCMIEQGTANPSPPALRRIADVLGVEIKDLEREPEAETA
ncbi:helix-turn-helix transcriptional regulator [Spirillospora sp. NPDC127200]